MKKVKVLKRRYVPTSPPIVWSFVVYLLLDNLENKLSPFYFGMLMVLLLFVHLLQWIFWLLYLFYTETPNIPELEYSETKEADRI